MARRRRRERIPPTNRPDRRLPLQPDDAPSAIQQRFPWRRAAQCALFAAGIAAVLAAFALYFESIPLKNNSLAIDWRTFWASIRGGRLEYFPVFGLRFPPWSLVPILWLGLLPMKTAWGILSGVGVMILVFSVPRGGSKPAYGLSILLLVLSFPALRNLADGNMENLVIGGILLMLYGFNARSGAALAVGLLLATMKPQEVALLAGVLFLQMMRTWPPRRWIPVAGALVLIIGLSLWWQGKGWWMALTGDNYSVYTRSLIDISLTAAYQRLGIVPAWAAPLSVAAIIGITLAAIWKREGAFSREEAGLLIAASLLAAPYAAGNSVLTLLAIGIIPLFRKRRWLGGLLAILISLPFLFSQDVLYHYQAYYWTLVTFLAWVVFVLATLRDAKGCAGTVSVLPSSATGG